MIDRLGQRPLAFVGVIAVGGHAAANYDMLCTAKVTGSWVSVSYIAALLNITATLLVLQPMRLSRSARLAMEPLRQPG